MRKRRARPQQHKRRYKSGKVTVVNKGVRPSKIGSSWKGPRYIHGPRRVDPKTCSKIRLGKKRKDGSRLVWCEQGDKWVRQSKITPKRSRADLIKALQDLQDKKSSEIKKKGEERIRTFAEQLSSKKDISNLKTESIQLQQKADWSQDDKDRLIDLTKQIKEGRKIGRIEYSPEEIKKAFAQEEIDNTVPSGKGHVTLERLRWRLDFNRKYGD